MGIQESFGEIDLRELNTSVAEFVDAGSDEDITNGTPYFDLIELADTTQLWQCQWRLERCI